MKSARVTMSDKRGDISMAPAPSGRALTATVDASASAIPFVEVEKMACAVAKSGLFGVKSPDQALALMLLAQAEGRHPVMAARDYHIIQGRPTLKSDTILARFQESGGRVEWHEYTNEKCEATFCHPQGGSVRIAWTIEQAKSAGLAGKDVWKQYPRAMLRARLIAEGVRTTYPSVMSGVSGQGEYEPAEHDPEPKYMGQAVIADEPKADPRVADLRKDLSACLKALRWSGSDLEEFLDGNDYTKADVHDAEKLEQILSVLGPAAQENLERAAEPAAEQAAEAPF